jgi:ribosome-binding factor A
MSVRQDKIASLIKKAVAMPVGELAKNLSPGVFATVTSVKVSSDLSIAKIYLSIMGGKKTPLEVLELLESRKSNLRHGLAKAVNLKFVPEIRIFIDDTLDQIDHIQKLLDKSK